MQDVITVRRFMDSDMTTVKRIEAASITELTPLSSLRLFYDIPSESFVVAEEKGEVVGFLVANIRNSLEEGPQGHILSIAVDPEHRRSGIGARLIAHISRTLKDKGARSLVLEVKLSNQGAREFYRRQGFSELQIIKHYYRMRGYSEDAIVMFKDL